MKNVSILIVEDEPELLARLVKYLSIFCDDIYQAKDGKEALLIYKEKRPDIVLTDINMPKLTGIEFIEQIRKEDSTCQIIILSAHTHTQDFLKVIPLNLVSYLVKPVQMDELKNTILQAVSNSVKDDSITLNSGYYWNKASKNLFLENEKIVLTTNETSFLDALVKKLNKNVSYEELHNRIYDYDEYSQDAIFTIAKRIRKKTQKELIKSCFKFGYKIETF